MWCRQAADIEKLSASIGDSGGEERKILARPRPGVPEASVNISKQKYTVTVRTPLSTMETSRPPPWSSGNKRRRSSQPLQSVGVRISHEE